jgi:hypothetical protein
MSGTNIKIGVVVDDGGSTKKVTNGAELLAKGLDGVTASATRASAAVKAAMAPSGGSKTKEALKNATTPTQEGLEYGRARAAVGTGAAGRDFANQAQGLGGLVRLYATYAANLFAVSAAFRALSEAMDTSNMVKGLDQLGAATGRNLGGLSKRLVELTDGAISFRESMQAVAQTTSGGMSSKNIERLALVAKNASMALGVSMPDAITRLSRGITKLEPELLDELGIMTKIGPATEMYARQVGKAASQLTDFEKRQAFANAVLAEGEEKFGVLGASAANPYDKLLASLKNVSQAGLEVVNKVLGPLTSILASSPTALAAAIAAIGIALVKQALPAIGEFKAGLAAAADKATQLSVKKAEDAANARTKINAKIIADAEQRASDEVNAVDNAEAKIAQLRDAGYKKNSLAAKLLSQDLEDIKEKDLKKQEAIAKGQATMANKLATEGGDPAAIKALRVQSDANMEVAASLRGAIKAHEDYKVAVDNAIKDSEKAAKGHSIYGLTVEAARKAQDASTKKSIISNAAYNGSLIGMNGAFKLMQADIEASGLSLSKWETRILKGKAGLAMFVGVLGTVGGAISSALNWIGLITAAVGMLDMWWSKNAKDMETFNSAITLVNDSVENASRTIDVLNKKGGYSNSTIEGISAMANALNELATSAEAAVNAATKAKASMGVWDKIKNSFFSAFGGGVDKNLAKALSVDVESALNILRRSGLGDKAESTFKSLLNVEALDVETVRKAILGLSEDGLQKFVVGFNKANTELNNGSSRLNSFKTATENTTKAYQDFIVSTANTNPMFKLGASLENLTQTMLVLQSEGVDELKAAMLDLEKSPEKAALFGDAFVDRLVEIKEGFQDQATAVGAYTNRLSELNAEIEKNKSILPKGYDFEKDPSKLAVGGTAGQSTAINALKQLSKDKKVIENTLDLLPKDKIVAAKNLFSEGISAAFKESSRLMDVALGQSAEKAAITIGKAKLAGLTGEERAKTESALNQQELMLRETAINTNIDLILSQERLTAAIDSSTAESALSRAEAKGLKGPELQAFKDQADAANLFKDLLGKKGGKVNLGNITAQEGDTVGAMVMAKAMPVRQRLAQQQASLTELGGEKGAEAVRGKIAEEAGRLEDTQKRLGLEASITQVLQARQSIVASIVGIASEQSILDQNELDRKSLTNKQLSEISAINTAIKNATSDTEREKQKGYKNLILQKQVEEDTNLALQQRQRLLSLELDSINKRYEVIRVTRELENTKQTGRLDVLNQELASYSKLYEMSEGFTNTQQFIVDKKRTELEATNAIRAAEESMQQKRDEADAKKKALDPTSTTFVADTLVIDQELTRQQKLTDAIIATANAQKSSKLDILNIVKQTNIEQERYNQLIATSVTFADSLKSVFGDLGEKVGGFTSALTEVTAQTEKNAAAMKLAGKAKQAAYDSQDVEQIAAAEAGYDAQKRKSQKDELSGNLKLVSSAKTMFKEKTLAYKALDKIEKAMHLYRLAMDAKELAFKIGNMIMGTTAKAGAEAADTGLTFAGVAARLPAYAAEIYGKTIGQLGPIAGPAVATALVAAMFGLFGKGGGGVATFVPNAEQRQETQGTAMGYDSQGNKVQVRRGVFGDTEAKSESIANSLEIIKDNSVDGLSYDNRMLELLTSIDNGINSAAKGIFNIQGLRSGSMFGTVTGTQSGGGLLGTGFLASKTSRNITDSGLLIEGTFAQLASDTNKSVLDFFEQVTVSKKNWYGKTKTWVETYRKEVDDATSEFFQDIFGNATEMFIEVGSKAGINAQVVNQVLNNLDLGQSFASLRGLKGEEFQTELSAIIGSVLDDASSKIFTSFESYANFGEGMLETVIRVVDTNDKINQQVKNLGINIAPLGFAITESLADLAGGMQNFIDQSNYFRENFQTEAERLAPTQKAVIKQLAAMGYASVDTKDEFKALVKSLDLTNDNARQTYQSLMDLAPGFNDVIEGITNGLADTKAGLEDTVSSFSDFAKNIKAFRESLILSASSTATPLEKYAEAKTQFESTYALALTGDKDAMNKVTSSANTLLDLGKSLYASSDEYSNLFNYISEKLSSAEISALASVDVAQLQLNALDSSVSLLSEIAANTAATAGITAHAAGGYASGWALVGERGPEMVNFSAPAQVYTADQTAGMFAPNTGMAPAIGAMVTEIKQLRQEVVQLRKDQQKQTGDIIISNYDALQKSSEEIATAVVESSQDTAWTARSKSEIK